MHRNWIIAAALAVSAFPLRAQEAKEDAYRPRTPSPGEMVPIKPGQYTTGDAGGLAAERPVRRVTLGYFQIKKTEVTYADYAGCLADGACTEPREYIDRRNPDLPVAGVSWFQARDFCLWWGGRLPSEAEWEAAARGPSGNRFPWGNEFEWTRGNFADGEPFAFGRTDRHDEVAPAGSFPRGATETGLMDMAGNVAEWVGDWFDPVYYGRSPSQNPKGPPAGQQKVIKGGSYRTLSADNQPSPYRAAARASLPPEMARPDVGFRCVFDGSNPLDLTDPEKP